MKTYKVNENVRDLMRGKSEEEVSRITKEKLNNIFSTALEEGAYLTENEGEVEVLENYTDDIHLDLGYMLYNNEIFHCQYDDYDASYTVYHISNKTIFKDKINNILKKLD